MALAGLNTFIRVLIVLLAGAIFALDQYFLYLYRKYDQVVFHWRFYSHIIISGVIVLFVIISEFVYRASRHRRHDYYDNSKKRWCGGHFWSIFRFIWAILLAGGILAWAVPVWLDKQRVMFTLPVGRNTPEAQAYLTNDDNDDRWINPYNIFDCPPWKDGEPLTYICKFDEQALYASFGLAALLIIEGFLTISIETCAHGYRKSYNITPDPYVATSHVVPMETLNKSQHAPEPEEVPKQKGIFRSLKDHIRRDEDYDVENNYSSAHHVGKNHDANRSLPALPVQPEEEDVEIRSDSAMISSSILISSPGPNPFLGEDHMYQQQLAYAQAGESSQNPYPVDVKRADGL
ncbi:hypothetical protein FBU30_009074 [Linnemannia zychae]|nr:hypothetical protein FBU30_009074 [Linnemannia zychae]